MDTCKCIKYILALHTQKPDVMEEIKAGHVSEEGVYRDFCDGTYIRSHPLFMRNQETPFTLTS